MLSWQHAAMVWPVSALATLWWALRSGRRSALGFALLLQVLAGLVVIAGPWSGLDGFTLPSTAEPFRHSGFWSPVLIALAAFVGAAFLHRRGDDANTLTLGWASLLWSVAWWAFAWSNESYRVLAPETAVALLIALVALTAGVWRILTQRLDWPQLGLATLGYLPTLTVLFVAQRIEGVPHPLAGFGGLVWPLALLVHAWLLRAQGGWLNGGVLSAPHVVGAWLFLLVASLEVQWHVGGWGAADSGWPMLGWLLVPLAYLWSLGNSRLLGRWPLREHPEAYAVLAAIPVAFFLLAWIWQACFQGSGSAPLPYLPLLNPLELGQLAALLGVALWWGGLREQLAFRESGPARAVVLGATAFVVVSAMVLRACHQWSDVAWQADALFASRLAQSALSIVWSVIAIALMLFANRSRQRGLWIVGALLVAVVVAKLFLVELAARGSLERIVSFIVVGLLLLVVGYFAPLPPKEDTAMSEEES